MLVAEINQPPTDVEFVGWRGAGWYFWDETEAHCHGPYANSEIATMMCERYFDYITRPYEGTE